MRRISLPKPDEFRSLASTLLAGETYAEEPVVEIAEEPPECVFETFAPEESPARAARLFSARLTEALEGAVERLLCDIACDVLARELQLAPADIERIVDRALQRFIAEEPLRVRVHPSDAEGVQCALPLAADPQLSRGDAILELRDGFVDASLGIRLETVLREMAV
jgi:Flagellar assembly protein FliH